MKMTNYSNFRENLKSYCDCAVSEGQDILISRKDGDVVLMSMEKYNKIQSGQERALKRILAYAKAFEEQKEK